MEYPFLRRRDRGSGTGRAEIVFSEGQGWEEAQEFAARVAARLGLAVSRRVDGPDAWLWEVQGAGGSFILGYDDFPCETTLWAADPGSDAAVERLFRELAGSAPDAESLVWRPEGVPMVRRPCPNDAMLIPQVAEVTGADGPVRFFWCWSCAELSAFVDEPGRLVARFGEDGRGGWRLFQAVGSAAEVQVVEAAASQVQPQGQQGTPNQALQQTPPHDSFLGWLRSLVRRCC